MHNGTLLTFLNNLVRTFFFKDMIISIKYRNLPETVDADDCVGVAAFDNLLNNSFISPWVANGAGSTFFLVNLKLLLYTLMYDQF